MTTKMTIQEKIAAIKAKRAQATNQPSHEIPLATHKPLETKADVTNYKAKYEALLAEYNQYRATIDPRVTALEAIAKKLDAHIRES